MGGGVDIRGFQGTLTCYVTLPLLKLSALGDGDRGLIEAQGGGAVWPPSPYNKKWPRGWGPQGLKGPQGGGPHAPSLILCIGPKGKLPWGLFKVWGEAPR